MSDHDAKLEKPVQTQGKRARASLEALLKRWGLTESSSDKVIIFSMGNSEIWLRVSGSGSKAIFEKYEPNET